MKKVGITGGIGSGKTTVCKVFELLGVPVFYADDESKKLLFNDADIKRKILEAFGDAVLSASGFVDRKLLSSVVFNNKEKLEQLNAILHPAVGHRFEQWVEENKQHPYILKEAAILFESGAYKQVDMVITVTAPVSLKIQRAMKRDNITIEQVEQRILNQMSDEDKMARSQFVVHNDEHHLLIPQILKIHSELIS